VLFNTYCQTLQPLKTLKPLKPAMPSCRGFVQGSITSWRVLFTLGMLGGAYVAAGITPGAFDVLPATYTVSCHPYIFGLILNVNVAAEAATAGFVWHAELSQLLQQQQ
jgi:hypothetical protein